MDSGSGIYLITCTVTQERYVGSSEDVENRRKRHFYRLSRNAHPNSYLQHAWNRHGADAFVFSVLEYVPVECLTDREQYWIDRFDTYQNGFNLAPQAGTMRGYRYTEEQRLKMSQSRKGQPKTAEHKAAISRSKLGVPKGPFSEQARRNMAEARRGNFNNARAYVVTDPSGSEHVVRGLPRFCAEHGLSYDCMFLVAAGKQRNHRGWTCRRFDRSEEQES
jgi:group I intron endonuclease